MARVDSWLHSREVWARYRPHPRLERKYMRTTWASRYVKVGNSQCIVVPKEVREKLGAVPGDLIVMRMYGRLLICRKLAPEHVVDVNELPADALPSAVRS